MHYEFQYDAITQVMGPVTVRSSLQLRNGEFTSLRDTFTAAPVKGSPWEGKLYITGLMLINGKKGAQFTIALKGLLTVPEFKDLVMGKKPVELNVTLFPDIQMPAPGVPVPIFAPPVTKQTQIAIPAIAPARIEVQVESVTIPEPCTYVKARMSLPSFVKPTDAEKMAMMKSIGFKRNSSAMSLESVTEQGEWRIALFHPPKGVSFESIAGGSYNVTITATALGVPLRQEVSISFRMQRNLVLQLSKHSVTVNEKKSASFTAAVWEIDDNDAYKPVPDAAISATAGGGGGALGIAPLSGSGSVEFTVSLAGKREQKSTSITVTAKADKSTFTGNVAVTVAMDDVPLTGELEVGFVPPEKYEIDPSVQGDVVMIRARVKAPESGDYDVDSYSRAQQSITFEKNGNDQWIDGPSGRVSSSDWWVYVNVGASNPDPVNRPRPPLSVGILVKATFGTKLLSKNVMIGLAQPPVLEVSPDLVDFLAVSPYESGKAKDEREKKVTLTLQNPGKGTWTFKLTPDKDAEKLVTISAPKEEGGGQVFTFTMQDQRDEPPKDKTQAWKTYGKIATSAVSGAVKIEGPDITVEILREGLFVEKIYTLQKSGQYKCDPSVTTVPVRIDLPRKNEFRVTKVKFIAMKWNGRELVSDDTLIEPPTLSFGDVETETPLAKAFNAVFKLNVEFNASIDSSHYLFNTWSFFIDDVIPGKGERLPATIQAISSVGELTVPLEFVTAKPDEKTESLLVEKGKCMKLIRACIPPDRVPDILKDLKSLKNPGADDYRVFRDVIWDAAWRMWAEDQKDYHYWESGWGKYLIGGAEGVKMVGDLSFILVVGYYTSHLGPVKSFLASTLATTIKDTAIEFYAYYVEEGNDRNIRVVGWEYAYKYYEEFIISNSAGVVDTLILHGFDPKNPATYKRVAVLWAWKFAFHLAHDMNKNGEFLGIGNAIYAATRDVFDTAYIMVLQEFVNQQAEKSMGKLWESFKKKVNSAVWGEKPQVSSEGEGTSKTEEPVPGKSPQAAPAGPPSDGGPPKNPPEVVPGSPSKQPGDGGIPLPTKKPHSEDSGEKPGKTHQEGEDSGTQRTRTEEDTKKKRPEEQGEEPGKKQEEPGEEPRKKLEEPGEEPRKKLEEPGEEPRKKLEEQGEEPRKKLEEQGEEPRKKLEEQGEEPRKKLEEEARKKKEWEDLQKKLIKINLAADGIPVKKSQDGTSPVKEEPPKGQDGKPERPPEEGEPKPAGQEPSPQKDIKAKRYEGQEPSHEQEIRSKLRKGKDGKFYTDENIVVALMKDTGKIRDLKNADPVIMQAFENTRREIYNRHDQALIEKFKEKHTDYKDKNIVVAEFSTPAETKSNKPGTDVESKPEKPGADRDYRLCVLTEMSIIEKGETIKKQILTEIRTEKWKNDSVMIFAAESGGPCGTLEEAWHWTEEHYQLPTDKAHPEACPDFSDQSWRQLENTNTLVQTMVESNIVRVARGESLLIDPQALGQMYQMKVADGLGKGDVSDSFMQANKGIKQFEDVLAGYKKYFDKEKKPFDIGLMDRIPDGPPVDGKQKYKPVNPELNMNKAMDIIRKAAETPADTKKIEDAVSDLRKERFGKYDDKGNMLVHPLTDFQNKMGGQFTAFGLFGRKPIEKNVVYTEE